MIQILNLNYSISYYPNNIVILYKLNQLQLKSNKFSVVWKELKSNLNYNNLQG
jgi:hypothetical protein